LAWCAKGNSMPAMLRDSGTPNNAPTVDESFHRSKRRDAPSRGECGCHANITSAVGFPVRDCGPQQRSREREPARLSVLIVSLIGEGCGSAVRRSCVSGVSDTLTERFRAMHHRETQHFQSANCSARLLLIPWAHHEGTETRRSCLRV
jgi:hypothetical protein